MRQTERLGSYYCEVMAVVAICTGPEVSWDGNTHEHYLYTLSSAIGSCCSLFWRNFCNFAWLAVPLPGWLARLKTQTGNGVYVCISTQVASIPSFDLSAVVVSNLSQLCLWVWNISMSSSQSENSRGCSIKLSTWDCCSGGGAEN